MNDMNENQQQLVAVVRTYTRVYGVYADLDEASAIVKQQIAKGVLCSMEVHPVHPKANS